MPKCSLNTPDFITLVLLSVWVSLVIGFPVSFIFFVKLPTPYFINFLFHSFHFHFNHFCLNLYFFPSNDFYFALLLFF